MQRSMSDNLAEEALNYHRQSPAGKLAISATKPMSTQRDLALAYSPGGGAICQAIVADPAEASTLTAKGNLVGVGSNGTAVLGFGAIGPLAAKPVMEGKAVLFKKFAGVDVFDIELAETDVDKLCDIIAAMEPTFGAINLEDIKAPECFEIERRLRERMNIPVFHDDQHGTAIVVGAAVLNGLKVVGKDIGKIKVVSTGGGAAGIACLNQLVALGLPIENVTLVDHLGVVHRGRAEEMNAEKARYAQDTEARRLDEVIDGADLFLGLSAAGVLKPDMVRRMAARPLIMALANPTPEILPDEVKAVRDDAVIATGRTDFPNQVNNVLCFPFIFRGALDVGATTINEEMKLACVRAVAKLATIEVSDVVATAYGGRPLRFGPEYILPKPFDPRLILEIAPAVAKAAMDSGVATRPIADLDAYRDDLERFVFRSGVAMKYVFTRAKTEPKRVVFAEGEDDRVLRAVQSGLDEGIMRPILVGRRQVIERKIEELGLRLDLDGAAEVVDIVRDHRLHSWANVYHRLMQRRGVSPDYARTVVRSRATVIAALMVRLGEADTMICGTSGRYRRHLEHIENIIGKARGVSSMAAMSLLILPKGTFFMCDTYVQHRPSAEQIAEITFLAADEMRRFGIEPKAALLSHSNFGGDDSESSTKMQRALDLILDREPDFEVEGEMHSDAALNESIRQRIFPASRLKGEANLLVMPTLDAANIAMNMVKVLADAQPVGPILMGAAKPVHIVTPSVTQRGLLNISALAVVDVQVHAKTAE